MKKEGNPKIKILSDAFNAYFGIINGWNCSMNENLYERLKQCFLPIEIQNGRKDKEFIRNNYVFYSNTSNDHGQNSTTVMLGNTTSRY